MERANDPMRYVQARFAMFRYAEDESKDINLHKFNTIDNSSGGFTKSLTCIALAQAKSNSN
jgi:hypothetical protein